MVSKEIGTSLDQPAEGNSCEKAATTVMRSVLLKRDLPGAEGPLQRRRHRPQQVRFKDLVDSSTCTVSTGDNSTTARAFAADEWEASCVRRSWPQAKPCLISRPASHKAIQTSPSLQRPFQSCPFRSKSVHDLPQEVALGQGPSSPEDPPSCYAHCHCPTPSLPPRQPRPHSVLCLKQQPPYLPPPRLPLHTSCTAPSSPPLRNGQPRALWLCPPPLQTCPFSKPPPEQASRKPLPPPGPPPSNTVARDSFLRHSSLGFQVQNTNPPLALPTHLVSSTASKPEVPLGSMRHFSPTWLPPEAVPPPQQGAPAETPLCHFQESLWPQLLPGSGSSESKLLSKPLGTLGDFQDLLHLVGLSDAQPSASSAPAGRQAGDDCTRLQSLEGALEASQQTIKVLLDVIQDLEEKGAQPEGRWLYRTGQNVIHCGMCRDCACVIYSVERDFQQQEGRFQEALSSIEPVLKQSSQATVQEPAPVSRLPVKAESRKSRWKCFWFL